MSKKVEISDFKVPGMRGGRRNHMMVVEKPKDAKNTLKRLIKYFSYEIRLIIFLFIAVFVQVVCTVFAPKLQSNAIDNIAGRISAGSFITQLGPIKGLDVILAVMLLVYFVHTIATFAEKRLSAILSQKIVKRMREDLFKDIVNLPIKFFDKNSHGDIMSRMTNDVENISNTVSQSMSSLFSGVLTVVGTVIMMFYLSPRLAILSCSTVLLTIFATKTLSQFMRKFYRKRQVLMGKLNGTMEEMITGYASVVAFNKQEDISKEFNDISDELTNVGIVAEILGGSMGPLMNVINNVGFVIIAAFGGYFAVNGYISIGVISAFIVYAKQFGRPIDEIAQVYGQIQTAIAGAERVFSVMDEECEDKSGDKNMDAFKGDIEFTDVNFSYVEGKPVLRNFNLTVKAGHKVALVGATGSGKTTVVNLLMRFYDIDSGKIAIDGVDIKEIDCNNLRKNTAIVLQDTVLFSDTIKNNLLYSNDKATDKEINNAVKMSNCDRMISRMSKKFDTYLSIGGQNISQGQRQLLSIARAFLANPKILILDEATSNVDTRTEKHIQNAMVNLMKNRTSLIIAHRLSTIQDADCIVVMDEGSVVEIGNHKELLAKMGRYYELYMTQFAGKTT